MVPAILLAAAVGGLLVPATESISLGMDYVAVWVGVFGVVAGVSLLLRREQAVPRSSVGLAWAAFLTWALMAAVASGRVWPALVGQTSTRQGWMTLVALTAIGLAAAQNASGVRALLLRYGWLVVLGESLVALARFAASPDSLIGGTLANSTYMGEALLLLLPWTLPGPVDDGPWARRGRFAALVLAVGALGATRSRAALLVAAVWLLWLAGTRWKTAVRNKVIAGLGLAAAAVAAMVAMPGSVFAPDGPLPFGGRIAMWQQSIAATMARPLLGWGPDGYWPGSAAVRTPEMAAASHSLLLGPFAADPHNFLVWVAVSTGIVGLALWLLFSATVVNRWRVSGDPEVARFAWAIGACLFVGLTAPVILHVQVLLAVVVGASLPLGVEPAVRSGGGARLWRAGGVAVATVLALASVVFALNAATRMPLEVAGADRSPALAARAVRASSLWALDPHLAYLASIHSGWAWQSSPTQEWEATDLSRLDAAMRRDGRDPLYALERARACVHYGLSAQEVDAAFAAAFERYPAYPIARAEYARYLADHDRIAEAEEQLRMIESVDDPEDERVAAVKAAKAAIAARK